MRVRVNGDVHHMHTLEREREHILFEACLLAPVVCSPNREFPGFQDSGLSLLSAWQQWNPPPFCIDSPLMGVCLLKRHCCLTPQLTLTTTTTLTPALKPQTTTAATPVQARRATTRRAGAEAA